MRPGFPRGLRVLVLDPDAGERSKAAALLREFGYEVQEAGTRRTALERLRAASKAGRALEVVLACSQALGLGGEAPGRGGETPNSRGGDAFRAALGGAPLLLLVNEQKASDVVRGIRMGALHVLPKPLAHESAKTIWQHAVRRMMAERGMRQGPVGVAARPKPGGAAGSGSGAPGKAKGKGAATAAGGGVKKGGSKGKSKGKNPRPPSNFDPHAPPPFALSGRYPLLGHPQEGAPEADMMPIFSDPGLADFQDMLPGLENEMALTVGGSAMSSRDALAFSGGAGGRGSGAAAKNGGSQAGKKRKAGGGTVSRGRGLTKEAGQHPPPLAMKPSMPTGGLGGWGQPPPHAPPPPLGYMSHPNSGAGQYGGYGAAMGNGAHPGGGLFSDVSDAKPSLGLSLKKTPSLLNLLGSPRKP